MDNREPLAELLRSAGEGDPEALDEVLPLVYEELKRLARGRLSAEPAGHTLDTTALVHEAYLRLVDQKQAQWRDRSYFLAIASTAMRRVLVDHARRHGAAKRGGGLRRVSFDETNLAAEERAEMLIALDEALDRLAVHDARRCRVVECRFFAGLTAEETAAALGVAPRTVKRDWAKAKSWLYRELYPADEV